MGYLCCVDYRRSQWEFFYKRNDPAVILPTMPRGRSVNDVLSISDVIIQHFRLGPPGPPEGGRRNRPKLRISLRNFLLSRAFAKA
jgi:hypothetical protein